MSDAFVVGEDFLSEHFFTSDAKNESFLKLVLDRRKEWDAAEHETSRSRFTKERGQLAVDLANLHAADKEARRELALGLYSRIRHILGFRSGEYAVDTDGPVHRFNTPGVESAAPLAVVEAMPAESVDEIFSTETGEAFPLLTPWQRDEKTTERSLTKAVSALFQEDDGPDFVLILAGRWLLVTEQARWAEGRYLAVDLQTVADRNDTKRGGEIDRALTICDAQSLAPDADGQIWWTSTLEQSVKHTVGVSKDLREGVRRSIEIIANDVVARRRAQGLAPLPADQAQPLARQALRFLYRILFLLYAEASPELGVLPVGAAEYDAGYSLDRLRELTLVEISTPAAREGTHFYESLDVLFRLVDQGHSPTESADGQSDGLEFHSLRADLFKPEAISHISEVGLGNEAVQEVLRRLLLSKESRGQNRGFISYAELGINQLGAVYEGLMSYTGFFAETDLYEVAKDGDTDKGSWVVPVERAEGIADKDFVTVTDDVTGEPIPVVHRAGQFVFRLSGRERQQSASYYTPEVLTKFVVSQALEELLDQDGQITPAEDILSLTVCEPALGSGAFAIEAVRQLAEQYLRRRRDELGEDIPPEDYPTELQRVKAYLALHNVYGVDLNATAVEFAEITLWLDTMSKGLQAPWFGLKLRRGNSLIGARRAVYTRKAVADKAWLKQPPTPVPLDDLARRIDEDSIEPVATAGSIHHFLLPADGWGASAQSKEARNLVPERVAVLKQWRRQFNKKPTKKEVDQLVELSYQVGELWTMALRRLMVAEEQTRRAIPIWGREAQKIDAVVTREQIEESLDDPNGAYQRLRRVMDAWCALWFWPLTEDEVEPPTWAEWLDALTMLLGSDRKARTLAGHGAATLTSDNIWEALADNEAFTLQAGGAKRVDEVLAKHPWLRVCEQVAKEQGFFHWQLDFATVFARGGFDLQVGNPPWVRPIQDVDALLAEGDPWWQLENKPSESQRAERREKTLSLDGLPELVLKGVGEVSATSEFVGNTTNYPALRGLQPDLYRCFMNATWERLSSEGIVSLLHPESHLTDERAGGLRSETYPRLHRHWHFVNELQLFGEIDHHVTYGVHIYGPRETAVNFMNASALYHPDTVERSMGHDGSGSQPGFKHEGRWDQRPHASRIEMVTDKTLSEWRNVLDPDLANAHETRMLYTVNREVADTLTTLTAGARIAALNLQFSAGWHECSDREKGYFIQKWGRPESWNDAILQGPHLHVATPLYKQPNPTMKHNQDWSDIDLETLAPDTIPATSYKPAGPRAAFQEQCLRTCPGSDAYRLSWRSMAANTGERTLIPAIIPPGASHLYTLRAVSHPDPQQLLMVSGVLSSLLADFVVRAVPRAHILLPEIERMPLAPADHPLAPHLRLRTLRLNCVTEAYADLWEGCWEDSFRQDSWTTAEHVFTELGDVGPKWTPETPLRRAADRRQALVEIDAIVAIMLGVSADQLATVYRTQFAVLYGYDHNEYLYDANGRIVPTPVRQAWSKKGDALNLEDRTHTNQAGNEYVYELPFTHYDREQHMRTAYAEFIKRFATPEGSA